MNPGAEVIPFTAPPPTATPAERAMLEFIRDNAQRQLDQIDQLERREDTRR